MHAVANTQSKPNLTSLSGFWRQMASLSKSSAISLESLIHMLEKMHGRHRADLTPWNRLFHALKAQPGWGGKTAALFVKNTIRIHRGGRAGMRQLHFLSDGRELARKLESDELLFLPVDAVIARVFEEIRPQIGTLNFMSINRFLQERYSAEEMLIWDDLWYWGFFTQKVEAAKKRSMEWNSDKFWCLLGTPKEHESQLKRLGAQFIKLVESGG